MTGARSLIERVVGQPHRGRFASLEGYRGLAALAVLVYHVDHAVDPRAADAGARPADNLGNFGVAVFFLLSGFLLFRPMSLAMFAARPAPSTGRFLLRRALRIYPAYWLAVTGWAIFASPEAIAKTDPVQAFFLLTDDLSGLGVAWTLAIEVRFYVFLAVLGVAMAYVARRLRDRHSVLVLHLCVLGGMYLTAAVTRVHRLNQPDGRFTLGGSMVNYLDWFALGMALATAVAWRETGGRVPSAVRSLADRELACFVCAAACFAGVVLTMNGAPSLTVQETAPGYFTRFLLQGLGAMCVLLPAVLGREDLPAQRLLRGAVPAAIGTVSYGIYLWHKVVLDLIDEHLPTGSVLAVGVGVVAVAVPTIVIATISHRVIERPALRLAGSNAAVPQPVTA